MDIQSIALGLVQGLTEFIPVSSSGHLILLGNFFQMNDNLHIFIETLDFGTLLALVIFFRKKILDLLRKIFFEHNFYLARNLIITSVPVAIFGFLLGGWIESNNFFTASATVACSLFIIGILMIFSEKIPHLSYRVSGEKLSAKRAFGVGCLQVLALIPGVSRSGITILAGKFAGLKNQSAAEYSFLVSIPVMLGLCLKLTIKDAGYISENIQIILLGNVFAFFAGIVAIQCLLSFLSKYGLKIFGIYRVSLAILIIVLLNFGVLRG